MTVKKSVVSQASKNISKFSSSTIVLSVLISILTPPLAQQAKAGSEEDLRATTRPTAEVQVPTPKDPVTEPTEILARSTYYNGSESSSDKDTQESKTASLVKIDTAHQLGLGVVAVDPKIIPYGSKVVAPDGKVYIALDTGGAVASRKSARVLASIRRLPTSSPEARAPVLDFYSYRQVGELWDHFTVFPYTGSIPFKSLKYQEKIAYLRQAKSLVAALTGSRT